MCTNNRKQLDIRLLRGKVKIDPGYNYKSLRIQ